MTGICDKCRRNACRARYPGIKTCDMFWGGETNYERLFGTPQKAAETIRSICKYLDGCMHCVTPISHCDGKLESIVAWLESEAE